MAPKRIKIPVDDIVNEISRKFRTFGGGRGDRSNPIAEALKFTPLAFAAGVDVREVVKFVLFKQRAALAKESK